MLSAGVDEKGRRNWSDGEKVLKNDDPKIAESAIYKITRRKRLLILS